MDSNKTEIRRKMDIIDRSACAESDYAGFLKQAFDCINQQNIYLAGDEDINALELAHLIPEVEETMLAAYVGINDAVCNKALVTSLLPQHSHNNVFVFDPEVYGGDSDVPKGTIDARAVLAGFEPPNETWLPSFELSVQD